MKDNVLCELRGGELRAYAPQDVVLQGEQRTVLAQARVQTHAQSEQQRLAFALEEMAAEMQVLKAIYQDELDAAKRIAAENTRTATTQVCCRFRVLCNV